jgi:hypothetical protein
MITTNPNLLCSDYLNQRCDFAIISQCFLFSAPGRHPRLKCPNGSVASWPDLGGFEDSCLAFQCMYVFTEALAHGPRPNESFEPKVSVMHDLVPFDR